MMRLFLCAWVALAPVLPAAAQVRAVTAPAGVVAPVVGAAPTGLFPLGAPALSLSLAAPSAAPLPGGSAFSAPAALAAPAPAPAPLAAAPAIVAAAAAASGPAADPRRAAERKVAAASAAVAREGEALSAPAADGGRASAERQFGALTGEPPSARAAAEDFPALLERNLADWQSGRAAPTTGDALLPVEGIDFSERQLRRVMRTGAALERAVAFAAGSVFAGAVVDVHSRGSSARLTHSEANPDYDVMALLPRTWTPEQASEAIGKNLPALKNALRESVAREAAALFPGVELNVSVEDPVPLNDPADGRRAVGVYMLPVHVTGPGGMLIDADATFTGRADYANDYPGYFADQLEAVRRLGGEDAVRRVLYDIRLAKRLFTTTIGSYKPWHGGPSGVGVEQLIMQSGRVSDADKGRTILEVGSFDKFMERIRRAAFDDEGRLRGPKKGKQAWVVHNAYMRPDNFLDLMSGASWVRLAYAAKGYGEARVTGRPVSLESLRWQKPAPPSPARPEAREVPVLTTPALPTASLTMTTPLRSRKVRVLVAAAVRKLAQGGVTVDKSAVGFRRDSGTNLYTVSFQTPPGTDAVAAAAALRALLQREIPGAVVTEGAAEPALKAPDAMLRLRPNTASGRDGVAKAAQRLSRRFKLGRFDVAPRPGADGAYVVGFWLRGTAPADFARDAIAFFKKVPPASLVAVMLPQPCAAAPQASDPPPGRLTLEMLEKFTQNGPAPSARGDAYLYAQGAKTVPAGLEASVAGRRGPRPENEGRYDQTRTLLLRRGGRAYVMLESFNPQGMPVQKPVKVPARLAQGVVTDALVEVFHDERGVQDLRPIGAYPADMIIGRVATVDGRARLVPLFEGDGAKALYQPLPIAGTPAEGTLLQAFVRSAAGSYEAVPLLDLGRTLTPEIAAREIALRHGARGYFDEAVIRQAEEVGRTQDPGADFRRLKQAHGRSEDLRALPFVTIDPVGAGDLDDAYYVRKEADGSFTWYLATADVAQYVRPGTPAFRAAARIGNTFYSVDKDGVSEYPMNHPVVSKSVSSLLAGKDSLAMISKMRFSAEGEFLLDESEVFLGLVRVQGRYTYDQVVELWKDRADHGIAHTDQVALARELAAKLDGKDGARGKLKLQFEQTEHRKGPDGRWGTFVVEHDPLVEESHRLIEELKVYGNRVIAVRLEDIAARAGVPHISRVHPAQDERVNDRLREELSQIGVPWPADETLWHYLARLREQPDVSPEVKETAQVLALRSRSSALYSADDSKGHEGLALEAKAYDHPSTPIRRFSDMYNRALLEAYLEGADPKAVYDAVLADLKELGFESFEEYLQHLNGREQAARSMDREMDEFMSVFELAKPENRGRPLTGYVKMVKPGKNAECVIQLRELPATLILRGDAALEFGLLDRVSVVVRGADVARLSVDASIVKAPPPGSAAARH